MRTTLDLNDKLLIKAKAEAVRGRATLTRVIEEGLEMRLRTGNRSQKRVESSLPVYRGRGGFCKGVQSSSNRSMMDAADDFS